MAQPKHMAVDEFWMQYAYQPYELINGHVVRVKTLGFRYSVVILRLNAMLEEYATAHNLGEVVGSQVGFRLGKATIRTPRTAFIGRDKQHAILRPYSYLTFPPDIAVEVIMPDDSVKVSQHKIRQYLKAGTVYLWAIHPELHQMTIFHRSGKSRTFKQGDTIQGGSILPGFKLPLLKLFPKPRKEQSPEEKPSSKQ